MPLHLRQVKIGRLTMGPHVVDLDASRRGYILVVNDRRFLFGERARWTTVTALVLMLHLVVLWGLTVPLKLADMPDVDQDAIQAELYQTPPPEVQPVMPVELMPRPVPAPQPQKQAEAQPQPQPQKVAQAAATPAPAPPTPQPQVQPQPAPQPVKPAPQVVNRPQDTFDTPRNPTLQARADVKLQSTQAPDQTLDPESKTANVKLKKKQEEELEARQILTATAAANLGDIKLHDSNAPVQTVVAPSGLTPDGTHLATGSPPAGGGAGGAAGTQSGGGKTGLKGGRGSLSQALQNDDYCLKAQRDGKPIPANCHMKSLTEMAALTAKLDPHLQKEADAHAFQQKYKTTPGNDAYWKRNSPTSNPGVRLPDDDQAGAYTSDRDQRVMAGTDTDPQNSIHKTAH